MERILSSVKHKANFILPLAILIWLLFILMILYSKVLLRNKFVQCKDFPVSCLVIHTKYSPEDI
jgi:hypothetical protein